VNMSKKPMNILIAASEAAPLVKVGGLGDVVGSLPPALRDLGCHVSVVMPAYREALAKLDDYRITAKDVPVTVGGQRLDMDLLVGSLDDGVALCLIKHDGFFDRPGVYGDEQGEYPDNPKRFIFLSRSIPVMCRAVGFQPDVILANDWHTGLVPALLAEGALPRTAGVFAIHNMGYLGLLPATLKGLIGLPDDYYGMEGMEYYGQLSLLKAGIVYAQAVTTVSPTYAAEIQTPDYGAGLDGLMRSVNHRLVGILNGVDYRVWDPATDRHVIANYSHDDLAGKRACKQDLLETVGLPQGLLEQPLVGMVTRLVSQKGCDLVAEAADELFELGIGLILLGTGDETYHKVFQALQARYADRFGLHLDFDSTLAHKVIAGCDMFLLPSLYEPCGLTQMFCLKYGTIPIARSTGGLEDTILDPDQGKVPGTGFKFKRFGALDMVRAIRRAVETFKDQTVWRAMMLAAMEQDFSWHRSAEAYLAVFDQAMAARRAGGHDG
jgi:starch synthase